MKKFLVDISKIFSVLLFSCLTTGISAQVNEEVNIIKAYDPTIGDAYKINVLPDINDSSTIKNVFSYKVYPKQLPVNYEVTPIQPAKMVGEPLTKLYSTYLKAGYGNYNTMLGELGVNLRRSKSYKAGLYVKHLSSIAKLKLKNDKKSPASYSNNNVNLFGKKFYEHSTLYGNAIYSRNAFNYYGYNTELYDTALSKSSIFQRYNNVNASVGLMTNYLDSNHLNYDVNLKYQLFEDHYSAYQNVIALRADFNKFYEKEVIGEELLVSWVNRNSPIDTNNNALISFMPWVKFFGNQWRVQCGLKMNVDAYSDSTFYHFYPDVLLEYNIVENFLIPFVGVNGGVVQNHFSKVTSENMFLWPGLHLKNTNDKISLFGGFKGNFSKRISFLVKGNYSIYNNMYFFVNDTLGIGNYFNVMYDDETQLLNFYGEISYKNSEKLNFFLKGNYYKYTLSNLEKPWHKPGWEVTLSTHYNLRNKIVVSVDLFTQGDQYAPNYKTPADPYKLNKIIDANLGLEYRYSKILSGYINFNNITAGKNYYWNFYPTQTFQVLGGLTYSF